jgi:branched-chain amino acid transport system ATP-binding protein
MSFLTLQNVGASYGSIPALFDVSITIERGEVVALLGANGAGKTTTLRAISRMVRTTGHITFDGTDITRLRTDGVARAGIAHVPEGRGTLTDLTVRENLVLGAYGRPRSEIRERVERVLDELPVLKQRQKQRAGTLSGGEQQMLAIGRALVAQPRLLLLDEPSMGLSPSATANVYELIGTAVRDRNLTVLLAEQDVAYALEYANRAYVLRTGYSKDIGTTTNLEVGLLDSYLS